VYRDTQASVRMMVLVACFTCQCQMCECPAYKCFDRTW